MGGLVSVFGFTLIPMVLAAGFLVDWLGKQAVLSGGFVLLIVSLAILARLETYQMALLAILVLGTGWSALVNVLNVTSPPAFLPVEDIPRRMAYAMNMGDFIFGMGAFLTPILVAILIRKLQLVRTFLVLSSLAIVPLLLGLGVHWEHLVSQSTETVSGGLSILLSDPVVWLCCLAFFCHVPIEASVATWATTLMTDKGVSEAGLDAVVRFLADVHGVPFDDRFDIARGSRHVAGVDDGCPVHCFHCRHRFQPHGLADLCDGRRGRARAGSDLPNVNRHSAEPCRAVSAWSQRSVCFSALAASAGRPSPPHRLLRQTDFRPAGFSDCHGLCDNPHRALERRLVLSEHAVEEIEQGRGQFRCGRHRTSLPDTSSTTMPIQEQL